MSKKIYLCTNNFYHFWGQYRIFCIFALDFSNKDGSIAIPKES